ncbi:MAG: TetR/AcrR family transcriptional regulator [Beijerinckiaceae bacterium]
MELQRKRQPDVTRQRLIEVAAALVAQSGIAALTLDAVAHGAGVSKGGLLHHFSDKAALIEAVATQLHEQFFAAVDAHASEDPDPHARSARAYVRAIASEERRETERWAAMATAFFHSDAPVDLWRRELAAARACDLRETKDSDEALIARLAADGLWFARVFGLYDIDPATFARIADALVGMTKSDPAGRSG